MSKDILNNKLTTIVQEISQLSKKQLRNIGIDETISTPAYHSLDEDVRKIVKSIADLHICIKYLQFDLEATKREKDSLQRRLDDNDQK